ncbi:MAG: ABC transporter ATP-binding protein, partial [Planctomycetes bacterium]|nr:ABC transporter ATP-binding protein [Planctomycetota bacterium]
MNGGRGSGVGGREDSVVRTPERLLSVEGLEAGFRTRDGWVRAVDGVSFSVGDGESFGIVGESGSGKSVTARSILQIVDAPGRIVGGSMVLHRPDGSAVDLAKMNPRGRAIRAVRGREIAMIFQEPMTALNPTWTCGEQVTEALELHTDFSAAARDQRALELFRQVGIPEPERRLAQYPHELSGGMRQRVCIAIALACDPELLIADEPTTALDVTIQAQILKLLRELKERTGAAVILITHDLGVVAETCRRVIVMYAGRKIEEAPILELFDRPAHPYT